MQRIGILGAGRVVQNRYQEVFLDELKDTKVTMVCDVDANKAQTVATALDAHHTTDPDTFFSRDDIDVALICTESGNHYNHTLKALNAGKHVIVEKPPTMFPAQVTEVAKTAADLGLMYAPIFQNRYNPAMKVLREAYDQGRFGKLVLATIRLRWCRYQDYYEDGWHGTWAMDGGVINQQAIHHVDALQWVCGAVDTISAFQANALNSLEAEDTMVASLTFENGALGVVEATTAARPEDFEASMSIVGEKGTAVIGGIALNKIDMWHFTDPTVEDSFIPQKYSQEVPTGYGLSHGPLMQDIIDKLNHGDLTPPITAESCVPTVQLVHSMYRSIEQESPVKVGVGELSERLGRPNCT